MRVRFPLVTPLYISIDVSFPPYGGFLVYKKRSPGSSMKICWNDVQDIVIETPQALDVLVLLAYGI
jgi:hypothetical protein